MKKLSKGMAAVLVVGTAGMIWADHAQAEAGDGAGKTGVKGVTRASGGSYQGPTSKSGSAQGPYYFFNHTDSKHRLVPKDSEPHPRTTKAGSIGGATGIRSAGRETVINYQEGDPDKPIVTGNTSPKKRPGGRHNP